MLIRRSEKRINRMQTEVNMVDAKIDRLGQDAEDLGETGR